MKAVVTMAGATTAGTWKAEPSPQAPCHEWV
jgi:hypothetical protein